MLSLSGFPAAPPPLDLIPALRLMLILKLTLKKDLIRVHNQVPGLEAGRCAAAGWARLVCKVPRETDVKRVIVQGGKGKKGQRQPLW